MRFLARIGTLGERDFLQVWLENSMYKIVNTSLKQKKMILIPNIFFGLNGFFASCSQELGKFQISSRLNFFFGGRGLGHLLPRSQE